MWNHMYSRLPGRGYHCQTDKVGVWTVPTHHCFSQWSRKEFETRLLLCVFLRNAIYSELKICNYPSRNKWIYNWYFLWKMYSYKISRMNMCLSVNSFKINKNVLLLLTLIDIFYSQMIRKYYLLRQLLQNKRVCNMCIPDFHDWTRTVQTASRKDSQGN